MTVRLTNAGDLLRAARGQIRPEATRRLEAAAETDLGVAALVLPAPIAEALGLPDAGARRVLYGDGRWAELRCTGSVVLDVGGRRLLCDGLVEPGRAVPRIGGAALEALDLVAEPLPRWGPRPDLPTISLPGPRGASGTPPGLARRRPMLTAAQTTGHATPALDETIASVEALFRTLTGREPPPGGTSLLSEEESLTLVNAQIDRLNASLKAPLGPPLPVLQPPLSVWESETELRFCLEMPGVAREGVSLEFTPGALRVSATTTLADARFRLCARERPAGEFRRTLALPPGIAEGDVSAQMRDGVLEVRVLRQPPAPDARPIPIP